MTNAPRASAKEVRALAISGVGALSALSACCKLAATCSRIELARADSAKASMSAVLLDLEARHRHLELLSQRGQMAHRACRLLGAVARIAREIEHTTHLVADFTGDLRLLLAGHRDALNQLGELQGDALDLAQRPTRVIGQT